MPDKGRKVQEFADELRTLIQHRLNENRESGSSGTTSVLRKPQITQTIPLIQEITPTLKVNSNAKTVFKKDLNNVGDASYKDTGLAAARNDDTSHIYSQEQNCELPSMVTEKHEDLTKDIGERLERVNIKSSSEELWNKIQQEKSTSAYTKALNLEIISPKRYLQNIKTASLTHPIS